MFSTMHRMLSYPAYVIADCDVATITGDPSSAAASNIALVISRLLVLNAPTA